jgi:hypothetical protein
MLQTQTVANDTLALLKTLMGDKRFSDFILAGGTNLALQIGHRQSIDLDLFPYKSFDAYALERYLKENYSFVSRMVKDVDTVTGYINDIKVDFVAHIYPILQYPLVEEGIRMYSLQDIACMKLVAISTSGTRLKDFVDVAFLSTRMSLNEMLMAYAKKYDRPNYFHAVKGLSYFDDINFDTQINLINKKFDWKKIEKRIREMIKHETKTFESAPI